MGEALSDRWTRLAIGAAVGFALVTLAVQQAWLLPTEQAAMAWVAATRDCATIGLAARLSIFGVGETSIFLTAVAAAACLALRQPRAAAALLLVYASLPIELALKHWLVEPLPGLLYRIPVACEPYAGAYIPAIGLETPHPYPSGYAIRVTYFLALAALLLAGRRRPAGRAVAGLCAVVLLGLLASRVVLSWHWPSDVIGGALLGLALAAATCAVTARTLPGQAWAEWRLRSMLAALDRTTRQRGAAGGADAAGSAMRPVPAPGEGHAGPRGQR
jgi:membrane-associated phospholipid phosphatase